MVEESMHICKKEKNKGKQILQSFFYCVSLAWKASGVYTILQFVFGIFAVFVPIIITWNTSRLMQLFQARKLNEEVLQQLETIMAVFLLTYIMKLIIDKMSIYVNSMQNDCLIHYIEYEMARKAVQMDLEYFDNPKYYDAFEAVKRDIYSVLSAVSDGVSMVSFGISVISCTMVLFPIEPLYTVLILCTSVPVALAEYRYIKKVYWWGLEHVREERQMRELYGVATGKMYAMEIRLYDIGKYLTDKYKKLWNLYFTNRREVIKRRTIWNLLFSIFPELFSVMALYAVALNVIYGKQTIGDFTLYSGLLVQLISVLPRAVAGAMGLYEKKLKLQHLVEFQKMEKNKKPSNEQKLEQKLDIVFKDVSFRYPDTETYVLKHVSFHLKAGEKLCIVGENGAGKSTLLKLLLRFYDVQSGQIFINNLPINEYSIRELRKKFSCFFQQSVNYPFTIEENVRISELDKMEDVTELEWALKMAGASKLIEQLPYGKGTFLTRLYDEKGVELSGGQNQKVALARMFFRNASVLVLDEPTSALDPKAEYDLFENIKKYCGGKTLLFVSHRLSNVFLADSILVIQDGEICAQGTHNELIKTCELYRKLYYYQSDKFTKLR